MHEGRAHSLSANGEVHFLTFSCYRRRACLSAAAAIRLAERSQTISPLKLRRHEALGFGESALESLRPQRGRLADRQELLACLVEKILR